LTLTIHLDPSWLTHPGPLGRILDHVRALEGPVLYAPPDPPQEPGDDDLDDDDLCELLDGIDAPAPAPPPAALVSMPDPTIAGRISGATSPPAPAPPWCGPPRTGQALYRWACNAKILPRVNAIGKARGWHRLVTHWEPDQVAAAYAELTRAEASAVPATNGRPH
jgi:hypothetical protein